MGLLYCTSWENGKVSRKSNIGRYVHTCFMGRGHQQIQNSETESRIFHGNMNGTFLNIRGVFSYHLGIFHSLGLPASCAEVSFYGL